MKQSSSGLKQAVKEQVEFNAELHQYKVGGVIYPSVNEILAKSGIQDYSGADPYYMHRGTAVHSMLEYYDQGELDYSTLDPDVEPYLEAWIAFLKKSGFEATHIEHRVFNSEYLYAGTIDRIGKWSGETRKVILEIKTGSLAPWVGLQLTPYRQCFKNPEDYIIRAVQLKKDGKFNIKHYNNPSDWYTFLSALSVVRWKEANV